MRKAAVLRLAAQLRCGSSSAGTSQSQSPCTTTLASRVAQHANAYGTKSASNGTVDTTSLTGESLRLRWRQISHAGATSSRSQSNPVATTRCKDQASLQHFPFVAIPIISTHRMPGFGAFPFGTHADCMAIPVLARQDAAGACKLPSSWHGTIRGFASPAAKRKGAGNRPQALPPAAVAAVAKGLITPGSRLLPHFKSHIKPHQLTTRLMKRRDMVELRDMVRVYLAGAKGLDAMHVCAALTRLQELLTSARRKMKNNSGSSSSSSSSGGTPAVGLAGSMHGVDLGGAEATAAAAAGGAAGTVAAAGDIDLAAACETVTLLAPVVAASLSPQRPRHLRTFQLGSATAALWAAAKLPPRVRAPLHGTALEALVQRATRSDTALHGASPRTVAQLLWALSKLAARTPDASRSGGIDSSSEPMEPAVSQEVVDAAVDAALAVTLALPARTKAYLKQCSPSVLAQMASSLAALKRLDNAVAAGIAGELVRRLPSLAFEPFSAADLVGVARGLAGSSSSGGSGDGAHAHAHAFVALAAHVCGLEHAGELARPRGTWRPEHIAHLAAAFADARVRHDGLLAALCGAAHARASEFRPWALEELRGACEALGYQAEFLRVEGSVAQSTAGAAM